MPNVNYDEQRSAAVERLARHLASECQPGRCELVADSESGRCREPAVAIRWEMGFADWVCEHHAETATGRRNAVILRPLRHDGTG